MTASRRSPRSGCLLPAPSFGHEHGPAEGAGSRQPTSTPLPA